MTSRRFKQVDVFTHLPFLGNPVAVVLDADGLETAQMQQIASWTNLSETTFVLPPTQPGADYCLRIFTPAAELSFAGHPTIGSAHALLEAGRIAAPQGELVQECGAGLVRLQVEQGGETGRWIAFELPEPDIKRTHAMMLPHLEAALRIPLVQGAQPRLIDAGARWIVVQLDSAQAVLDLQPDMDALRMFSLAEQATGVVVFGEYEPGQATRIEVRAFAPAHGIAEDPVCGSGNGCVGAFIRDSNQAPRFGDVFLASQGRVLGRDGRIRIAIDPAFIRVGGMAVTCIDGKLST